MNVIFIMWLRELRRYTRSRAQIIASLGQPLLYLLALGFGMGPVFQKAGQGNYVQFVAPGVIAMTVLFSSVFSGIGLLFDRQFGFLKETLVAPVPRFQVMFGRTLGASTVAVIQGTLVMVVCFMAGFRVVKWAEFPLAFVFMGMIACLFAALGTAIGSMLENMQGFQLIMNFLVMPMFFLSGALYPINNLPKVFSAIISLDPLAYGVDALRAVLIDRTFYGLGLDVTVMAIVALVFLIVGTRMFSKIQV
ncbi:MAG TPA: ABC transporter permease [Candidatus Angelobacter sp.]|jgi:ABC-2 type transport system permease protein|nr:ABC transporter permease [Candidatus Angelobacter sp.]